MFINVYGCIAYPCNDKRAKGSGFCAVHKETHKKRKFKMFQTDKQAGRK